MDGPYPDYERRIVGVRFAIANNKKTFSNPLNMNSKTINLTGNDDISRYKQCDIYALGLAIVLS